MLFQHTESPMPLQHSPGIIVRPHAIFQALSGKPLLPDRLLKFLCVDLSVKECTREPEHPQSRAGHGTMHSDRNDLHHLAAWPQCASLRPAHGVRRLFPCSSPRACRAFARCGIADPQVCADFRALPRLQKTTRRFCEMKAVCRAPNVRGATLFRHLDCRPVPKKKRAPASSALFVNAHAGVGMSLSHFDKNRAKKKAPLGAGQR